MIEAYRRLATATEREETDAEYFAQLDSAIVDVQLFGSPRQVAAAQMFVKQLSEKREARLSELLADLRSDLREELKLDRVEGPLVVLRPTFDENKRK